MKLIFSRARQRYFSKGRVDKTARLDKSSWWTYLHDHCDSVLKVGGPAFNCYQDQLTLPTTLAICQACTTLTLILLIQDQTYAPPLQYRLKQYPTVKSHCLLSKSKSRWVCFAAEYLVYLFLFLSHSYHLSHTTARKAAHWMKTSLFGNWGFLSVNSICTGIIWTSPRLISRGY